VLLAVALSFHHLTLTEAHVACCRCPPTPPPPPPPPPLPLNYPAHVMPYTKDGKKGMLVINKKAVAMNLTIVG
jgi:hypothetical protein